MCGIAGIVFRDGACVELDGRLGQALDAIQHRGPDGVGTLLRPGISAGMRRLAIVDLAGGDQPIFNEDGTVGVLFNGEIYNHRELRRELVARGHRFRTQSDTEVLVHLYEDEGPAFVSRLDGMFAFCVWDAKTKTALLARDRFGIKPLHLHRAAKGLAFGSEIKALVSGGWLEPQANLNALPSYLAFGWVPEDESMWKGVERLPPGCLLVVRQGVVSSPVRYHRHQVANGAANSPEAVRQLLREAVQRQVMADVPVGLFLSGGLDSSLLAAVASERGLQLPCHTVIFDEDEERTDPVDSDAPYARAVAHHFGLPLHEHHIRADHGSLLPRLVRQLDEPAADPAIINAFLIAEAARPTTKVLLSGMGADEVAGGYRRHVAAHLLRPYFAGVPQAARQFVSLGAERAGGSRIPGLATQPFVRRILKALERLPVDMADLGQSFASWTPPDFQKALTGPPRRMWPRVAEQVELAEPSDPLAVVMAFDMAMYLPSHNLHYMDKMTMAASVEVRVPFLDNALATALLRAPSNSKMSFSSTKCELRAAARGLVPDAILKRPKTGFGAPIRAWLDGSLREMTDDLLSPTAVRRRGLFDSRDVQAMLRCLRDGSRDVAIPVWGLLTLELWFLEVLGA